MQKLKLFCFPYAGGSTAIYNKWRRYVDPAIELVPVELAGRGKRIHEALYKDLREAVDDVFTVVTKNVNQVPYAIFGHSMGAIIAHSLARKLRECADTQPVHIFFSGRGAPHVIRSDEKKYHLMNDYDFKHEIIELGGTSPEFFEHPELLELFLPLLKNDFKIAEGKGQPEVIQPLDCNITVFAGKGDDLTEEQCDGWKKHTNQMCTIHYFNGGHFFLHNETEQLVRLINNTLLGDIFVKFRKLELID
jgi:surfactin synthase thioesterase subunit